MLRGLALVQENEESLKELLPPVTMRQMMGHAINYLSHFTGKNRSTLSSRIIALSIANQALEARVVELERRLADLTITLG